MRKLRFRARFESVIYGGLQLEVGRDRTLARPDRRLPSRESGPARRGATANERCAVAAVAAVTRCGLRPRRVRQSVAPAASPCAAPGQPLSLAWRGLAIGVLPSASLAIEVVSADAV